MDMLSSTMVNHPTLWELFVIHSVHIIQYQRFLVEDNINPYISMNDVH